MAATQFGRRVLSINVPARVPQTSQTLSILPLHLSHHPILPTSRFFHASPSLLKSKQKPRDKPASTSTSRDKITSRTIPPKSSQSSHSSSSSSPMFRRTGPNAYKLTVDPPSSDAERAAMLKESVRLISLDDPVSHGLGHTLGQLVAATLWRDRTLIARALWMYAKLRQYWYLVLVGLGATFFFDVEIRPRVGREVEDWPGRDGIERRMAPITVECG